MKAWFIAVALVGACKSGTEDAKHEADPAHPPAAKPTTHETPAVPMVTVATVLAKDDGTPPLLVLVDSLGEARLAAAASWADLDAGTLQITRTAVPSTAIAHYAREQLAFDRAPLAAVTAWDKLTSLGDPPPPPPPKEEPPPADKALTPNAATERLARIPGAHGAPPVPNADGTPSRVAQIGGVVVDDGKLDRIGALIVFEPTAKATQLIDAVRDTEGAIAVTRGGKIRPLRVQFARRTAFEPRDWLEARVSAHGVSIEAVPDVPVEVTSLDTAQLVAALDKARSARSLDAGTPVDVLVDPDVRAQRLIDVLVALDGAGVRSLGLGTAPTGEQLARRGYRPMAPSGAPTTTPGSLISQGDVDKAVIRKVVKAQLSRVHACYRTVLAGKPTLGGSVQAQFFITPNGLVASASGTGLDPGLSSCVAGVIKTLEFPKRSGGTQANYTFELRP